MRGASAFDRSANDPPSLTGPVRAEPATHSGRDDFRGHGAGEVLSTLLRISIYHRRCHWWHYTFLNHMSNNEQEDLCLWFPGCIFSLRGIFARGHSESPSRAESHFANVR